MADTSSIPADFNVGRFRMLTTVSGACFAGFMGVSVCTMFGWFGRPQWWWLVMSLTFGAGVWYAHSQATQMRSELASAQRPSMSSQADSTGVPAERPVLLRYCSSCHTPVRRGVVFCTACGQHLGEQGGYFE